MYSHTLPYKVSSWPGVSAVNDNLGSGRKEGVQVGNGCVVLRRRYGGSSCPEPS